ncbi:glutamate--cysteine ligase [Nocardioides sp. CFH 31398]|uniref:carboxylate-amine ligase n=1 Tax=Nocardioides sp. CFH 31398 TaxID=2919579 RepID=UPI001F0573A1|nr:glutamate--cysteine ligase [Nocardioides sp. CFH 31398]MCH1867543.1 glutamate--cysteine ligase [Nocardioides sp. CFH 31398]
MVRSVGLEEELLLVDPATGQVRSAAPRVLQGQADPQDDALPVEMELFRHQVETASAPSTSLAAIGDDLRRARRTAGEAAGAEGLALVACGVVPRASDGAVPSPDDRYRDIVDRFGALARAAGTCGMHVHVDVDSPEQGVAVIDRVAPWLPVLLAISANSPFYDDQDTGYSSWRAQVWSRWPTAGPAEPFGSLAEYRRVGERLLASGAARDEGMLYFDARLGQGTPTVELRVTDVCTDVEDALLVAALARALVERSVRAEDAGETLPSWRVQELRAAQWRASRDGVTGALLHPVTGETTAAREVLRVVRDELADLLAEAGDLERVDDGLERVLARGGASWQRSAYERGGTVRDVVLDLAARTEATWADGAGP